MPERDKIEFGVARALFATDLQTGGVAIDAEARKAKWIETKTAYLVTARQFLRRLETQGMVVSRKADAPSDAD